MASAFCGLSRPWAWSRRNAASAAQVALAWRRRHPVATAPIVGALKTIHIDEAIAVLAITLSDEEAAQLEASYTARRDLQGMSDPAVLARMAAKSGVTIASA